MFNLIENTGFCCEQQSNGAAAAANEAEYTKMANNPRISYETRSRATKEAERLAAARENRGKKVSAKYQAKKVSTAEASTAAKKKRASTVAAKAGAKMSKTALSKADKYEIMRREGMRRGEADVFHKGLKKGGQYQRGKGYSSRQRELAALNKRVEEANAVLASPEDRRRRAASSGRNAPKTREEGRRMAQARRAYLGGERGNARKAANAMFLDDVKAGKTF